MFWSAFVEVLAQLCADLIASVEDAPTFRTNAQSSKEVLRQLQLLLPQPSRDWSADKVDRGSIDSVPLVGGGTPFAIKDMPKVALATGAVVLDSTVISGTNMTAKLVREEALVPSGPAMVLDLGTAGI